ncbi:uncharacterized protein YqjF (DUF2071 family) [Oikeobacillus pervagus]|uniref:Uncharacterized protein YqjF (DUF2071 family) n=1 Tax=Oikeobacillus pervagus TaxID=1325931 RepID=A0AAJ1T432_9BACI|nr:DUF2071 domain-containing protein [Oikeobacillus pervagus]MDQ0216251.1 uncharacterized protein YqjF (DUF2071 family) [Oikeobacillus pervagus]
MRQTWSNLLFLHWPISPDKLRRHIPESLQIDTFNGTAWIGVVVFLMEGVYPRGFRLISIIPPFPEINVKGHMFIIKENQVYSFCL